MAPRLAAHLPRFVVLGVAFLLAAATLTYGAAKKLSDTKGKPTAAATAPTVVVPDLTGQVFTFAKGTLEDAGFAWQVVGSVRGYAVNRVVAQTPAGGTKLVDTGAPTVRVTLARTRYQQTGQAEDVSPYIGTAVVPAVTRVAKPVASRPAMSTVATTTTATTTTATAPAVTQTTAVANTPATAAKATAKPAAKRPPAFVVRSAPKEPLTEMPLSERATLLSRWLSTHPKATNAAVRHFVFQNAWIVAGAKFGWWHGALALKLLIAADRQAERIWGIGHKSELAARHALAEVKARSR